MKNFKPPSREISFLLNLSWFTHFYFLILGVPCNQNYPFVGYYKNPTVLTSSYNLPFSVTNKNSSQCETPENQLNKLFTDSHNEMESNSFLQSLRNYSLFAHSDKVTKRNANRLLTPHLSLIPLAYWSLREDHNYEE